MWFQGIRVGRGGIGGVPGPFNPTYGVTFHRNSFKGSHNLAESLTHITVPSPHHSAGTPTKPLRPKEKNIFLSLCAFCISITSPKTLCYDEETSLIPCSCSHVIFYLCIFLVLGIAFNVMLRFYLCLTPPHNPCALRSR